MRVDPHYPPVFHFYLGLANSVRSNLKMRLHPSKRRPKSGRDNEIEFLFLGGPTDIWDRKEEAAAAIAAYNAIVGTVRASR